MRTLYPVALLALAACKGKDAPDTDVPPVESDLSLERVDSCDGLRAYLGDVMVETLVNGRYGLWWDVDMFPPPVPAPDQGGGPSDYTTTTVQEEGVDEIDLVKTDGEYLYIASDRALHIVDSWPADTTALVASVELDGYVSGLFLRGDTVLVVYHVYDPAELPVGMSGVARLAVFDVSDRTQPILTRTLDIEGSLADARRIESDAYLVLDHWVNLPVGLWEIPQSVDLPELDWTLTGDAFEAARQAAMDEARTLLEPEVHQLALSMDLGEVLPQWADSANGGQVELLHACTDLYRPSDPAQHGLMSVVQLDLDTGEVGTSGVLSSGWTVYASLTDLYVAQSRWWSWWDTGDAMTSTVHRFALDPDGEPTYTASGEVPGWLYDQFAMSAYDGYLRVATTDTDWWWGTATGEAGANNVFVIQEDAGSLDIVGEVRGIAPGEQIQAVRMLGELAYVVTFRQIDPLFVLDLSDPTAPAVVGELELPGYSAYLHPYGADRLLAVGMAGLEDGTLTGLAVNLFDIADPTSPALVDQATLEGDGWSWSEALWDHHAFTFHRDVLSIPAYLDWTDPGTGSWSTFSGLVTFAVTPSDVTEGGRVDHRDLVQDSECLYELWYDYAPGACDADWWYATVRRSVYVEDNLYSISDYGVKVNDLNDPSVEIARVLFHPATP